MEENINQQNEGNFWVPPTSDESVEEPVGESAEEQSQEEVVEQQEQITEETQVTEDMSEEAIAQRYEEITSKAEEDITEEEKAFVEAHRPRSIIDLIKDIGTREYGVTLDGELIDENEEGLQKSIALMVENASRENTSRLFKQYPQLEHMYQYLSNGGNPEAYNAIMYPDVDFSKITINTESPTPEDERAMDYIIAYDLGQQGLGDEKIREILGQYDTAGIKAKMAEISRDKLAQFQSQQKETILEQQKIEQAKIAEEYKRFIDTYSSKVKAAKEIGNIPIAEKDKDEFIKFMFNVRNDSTIKEIPISQEILYHALNDDSPKYGEQKYSQMRDAIYYFVYMYEKDPSFINKIANNRAMTMRTSGTKLPGFSPVDRMKEKQVEHSRNSKQGEFSGTPAY